MGRYSILRNGSKIKQRTNRGSGIIEGVTGLWVVVSGTVAAVLLLVNVGMSTFYKEKIAFVTNNCATFAASKASWGGAYKPGSNPDQVREATIDMAAKLLKKMGLPQAQKVTVEEDAGTITVSIEVSSLALIGKVAYLPSSLTMKDVATAAIPDNTPPGFLTMQIWEFGRGGNFGPGAQAPGHLFDQLLIPVYGSVRGNPMHDSTPANVPVGTASVRRPAGQFGSFVMETWANAYAAGSNQIMHY